MCTQDCATHLLPFWADCHTALGPMMAQFEPTVSLCQTRTPSLAEQLNVQCTDGTTAADCVPSCVAEFHGYLMLLNIDGSDTKLTCVMRRGLFSWVGMAVRLHPP